jgi:hypothetical protein
MDGLSKNLDSVNGNYGFKILNQYLPYNIELNDQVLNARSALHETDKVSILDKIIDLRNKESKDWWNSISKQEKESIELGLKDAESGKLNPHSKARELYEKWS